MGLLPPGARVSGAALWKSDGERERNLAQLSEKAWRAVRGREIAMVFQEPMTSLNPVMRIGAQIAEAVQIHAVALSKDQVRNRVLEALRHASVPEPEVRAEQFPHQLSGGLRPADDDRHGPGGRAEIAHRRRTVQKQILDLLASLRRELQIGLVFITHDLGVVAQVADRVAVMYAGRIVEEGPTDEVLRAPRHPYTQGLLAAVPELPRGVGAKWK
jgi:peptide/nickel transport system ATP-binding protein